MAVKDYRIHCGKSTLVLFQFWRGIMRAWSQKTQIGYRLFKYSLSLRLSVQQSFQHAGIYYMSNSISLDGITGNALRCLQTETLTASHCVPFMLRGLRCARCRKWTFLENICMLLWSTMFTMSAMFICWLCIDWSEVWNIYSLILFVLHLINVLHF